MKHAGRECEGRERGAKNSSNGVRACIAWRDRLEVEENLATAT